MFFQDIDVLRYQQNFINQVIDIDALIYGQLDYEISSHIDVFT
jgi:hypothetical protein